MRYLEAFPDGGFFAGNNFVFDARIAMSSDRPSPVGSCILCKSPWDNYKPRRRCSACRMLLLVCTSCSQVRALGTE